MEDHLLEWQRVKRPLMVVRACAYLIGTVNMSMGGPGGRLVAAMLVVQVVYSLVALTGPLRSVRPFAFADVATVGVTAILVGLEPTSVHMLFAASVLGVSMLLDRTFARASWMLAGVFVVAMYVLRPLGPFVDVPQATVDQANFASGVVGLVVGAVVLATVARAVQASAAEHEMRIDVERRRVERQAQFLAMVNHELRTPLTSIRGFASVLDDSLDTVEIAEAREYVRAITDQSEHLARLVDDVLVALKVDAGTLTIEAGPIDVDSLFGSVANIVNHDGAHSIRFDQADVATIIGDRDRLIQVLRNLIDNAIKYGGTNIEVGARTLGSEVEIWVADDGPGIPGDALESVFGAYVQMDASHPASSDGLGLGLAICRRLVDGMGGSLSVQNRPTGGARFSMLLPDPKPDLLPDQGAVA
jgi:signal transduction histidine kinase